MKKPFFLFLIINLLVSNLLGQDEPSLKVGDTAPGLVLNSTNNSIQSFSFPYQNRITLLFFKNFILQKSPQKHQ